MSALLDFPLHEELSEPPLFYIEPRNMVGGESEDKRQRAMVANLRAMGFTVWHNQQSGRRSDYERTTMHRNGAIAGVPDLTIHWTGGTYYAEVKDRSGKPSRAQIDVMNDLVRRQIPCGVHRTWETLALRLQECGAPVRIAGAVQTAGNAAREIILRLIRAETDPSERKAKIMIARQDGHLSDAEAEEWIARDGLRFA